MKTKLKFEEKSQSDDGIINSSMAVTPAIDENYWQYRIEVGTNQAIIAFPKFFTIGIGFQHEKDWNTNLPYSSDANKILSHIWHNRGENNGKKFKEQCLAAIRMIQGKILAAQGTNKSDGALLKK